MQRLLAARVRAVAAETGPATAEERARGASEAVAEAEGANTEEGTDWNMAEGVGAWEAAVKVMVVAAPGERLLVAMVAAVTGWAAAEEAAATLVAVDAPEVLVMERVKEAMGKEAVARAKEEEERATETAVGGTETAEKAQGAGAMASTEVAAKAQGVAARDRAVVATVTVGKAVLGLAVVGMAVARVGVGTAAAEARAVERERRCNVRTQSNEAQRRRPSSTPRSVRHLGRTWRRGHSPH